MRAINDAKEHAVNPNTMMERLVEQYEGFFDLTIPFKHDDFNFLAHGHYYQQQERYVLVRSAKMYGFEVHEYVFFVESAHLTMSEWIRYRDFIKNAEKDFVKPHKEHMYSYMTLMLLCENIDDDVRKSLKRFHYTKNYRFSLDGYCAVRVAAADLSSEKAYTNMQGRDLKKVLERALHA